jgi:Cu+-exporting ATPase
MAHKDNEHVDPVCGMTVREDSAAGKSGYKGEKYYFCSTECKNTFDSAPEEYATSVVPKSAT